MKLRRACRAFRLFMSRLYSESAFMLGLVSVSSPTERAKHRATSLENQIIFATKRNLLIIKRIKMKIFVAIIRQCFNLSPVSSTNQNQI